MVRGAEKLGFSARAVKGDWDSLVEVALPTIAHVKTREGLGHFVVLHRLRKNSVVVADPARGMQTLPREEFVEQWTGYLLMLIPDQERIVPPKVGAPIHPWWRFWALLCMHKSVLVEAGICALFMTLLGLSTSYFVQHLVDSVLVWGEGKLLNALGLGMLVIMIFRLLFGMLREYLLAHVGRKINVALISAYSRHVLGLPMQFFETRRIGEILSRINDASSVRAAVSGTTLTAILDGLLVVGSSVVLWIYDVHLAMVATAFVPFLAIGLVAHHPAAKRRSRELMENSSQLSAHLVEDISGVETVKAFGVEVSRTDEGDRRLIGVAKSNFGLSMLGLSMGTIGTLVTSSAGLVVLWYGGHRVVDGALTIGQLMFFYTLLGYLLGPVGRLTSINLSIQEAFIAIDRLYEIMDLEAERLDEDRKKSFEAVRDAVELRDVSFQYSCRGNVLDKLAIRIPAGSRVAIVGESGSGKSTLLKLLMRYYDPTNGRITIDGVDMRDFRLASLRSGIGLVSQDPFIFNATVYDNICLGSPDATVEDVTEAARAAGLEDFINELPERYETIIGERGANLSGGQRQRLAIARALVRKPQILIFDEATSHLDTETEKAIQATLQTALAGKTVILVAHRLSTVKDADLIYVLHKGKVVEQGSHRDLLALRGRYWRLCQAQIDTDEQANGLNEPDDLDRLASLCTCRRSLLNDRKLLSSAEI
jgi:ATP-binding cassette subfamily B protein